MSDTSDAGSMDLRRRADEQEAGLGRLAEDLAALRREIAAEVRTRRVAVVEDDGFERVAITAAQGFGAVAVHARTAGEAPTCAELVANDAGDSAAASVLCALTERGDVVGSVELVEGAPPRVFLAGEPRDDA